ncbi:MAG TPA: TIGR04282 family arsenosugar biosynthesis glycosyltransferase [Usitatibacter sp.]|nr:TIGR04282 family arsenosugar biosynthesis glycosyltransferase [Usitatibacter sp.]
MFAKAPVPGAVKTRLAGVLGADAAASLHAGLVRHALSTAVHARLGPVSLWCAPDTAHPFFARCAEEFGARLDPQRGDDLGARMRHAFERAWRDGARLLVIGADCPALAVAHLHAAAQALRGKDAVFVPAEDGGYVLVGLARPIEGVFEDVPWGTAAVMTRTRERLRAAGASWTELPPLWDVDRPDDYARLQREGLLPEVLS